MGKIHRLANIICDRCGCEWLVHTPDGEDDIFFTVQKDMGRIVCPECLGWAEQTKKQEPKTQGGE